MPPKLATVGKFDQTNLNYEFLFHQNFAISAEFGKIAHKKV